MRWNWNHRLAGLAAAITVALGAGPAAYLTAGLAPVSGVTAAAFYCPAGTHWDNVLHHCV